MSIWNKASYKPDEWINFRDPKPSPVDRPRRESLDPSERWITTSVNIPRDIIDQLNKKVARGTFLNRSEAIRYYLYQGLSNTE